MREHIKMRTALTIILLIAVVAAGAWFGGRQSLPHAFAGPTLYVSFIDLGDGDSVLVQTPEGGAALIGAGGPDSGKALASYLKQHGVSRLDLLVLSCPRPQHLGGATDIVDDIHVEHVLDTSCLSVSPLHEDVLRHIAEKHILYKTARAGQIFRLGNLTRIDILLPQRFPLTQGSSEANNIPIVARVSFGGVNILLLDGIGSQAEGQLIAGSADLRCNVVKLGSEGGSRAASNEFLRLAKPAYAALCAGSGESEPDRETLRRLEAAQVQTLSVRGNGAVVIATDGHAIRFGAER
jgi:competence protein ComEC